MGQGPISFSNSLIVYTDIVVVNSYRSGSYFEVLLDPFLHRSSVANAPQKAQAKATRRRNLGRHERLELFPVDLSQTN